MGELEAIGADGLGIQHLRHFPGSRIDDVDLP